MARPRRAPAAAPAARTAAWHYQEAERLSWVVAEEIQGGAERTLADLLCAGILHALVALAADIYGPDEDGEAG